MALYYVTPTYGGNGTLAQPEQVDGNFFTLESMIAAALDHASSLAVSISDFTVVGNQMTVELTDSSTRGPFTIPVVAFNFRGAWQPSTSYLPYDIVTSGGSVYEVLIAHTSASTFNAGANDGHGDNYYALWLSNPGNSLPTGGAVGQSLIKSSTSDFAATWGWGALANLGDVALTTLSSGQQLTWNGTKWANVTPSAISISMEQLTDFSATSPKDAGDLVFWAGSNFTTMPQSDLVLTPPQLRNNVKTALPTSGSVSIDGNLGDLFTITPSADCTLSMSSAPVGARITILITASGTSSFNLTFDSGTFASAGVLATGVVDQAIFTANFICDGGSAYEMSRAGPLS